MAKPSKCISVSEAQGLQDNWVQSRVSSISNLLNEEDARDFTFSVDDLQEYIDYVKEESAKAGITNPGIRIFFAAYDNKDSNKATVFLGATDGTQSDSDNNYNIDPLNRTQGGWPPNTY